MTGDPLISILVPLYNHECYIAQTLNSIISQTYRNIEVILVNDGSPDNSEAVAKTLFKKLEERCSNFVYISVENSGVCATLNLAASRAAGEFLLICSSDDLMLPSRVTDQLKFAYENPTSDLYYANGYQVSCSDDIDINNDLNELNKLTTIYPELLSGRFGDFDWMINSVGYIPSPSFFCSKEFFSKQCGFDQELVFEDVDFYLRAADIGYCSFDPTPVFVHRLHGDNAGRKFEEVIAPGIEGMIKRYESDIRFSTNQRNNKVLGMLYKTISVLPERIYAVMQNRVLIAWGAGGYYRSFMEKHNIFFECIVDADPTKQGKSISGVEIRPPAMLRTFESGSVFIVITSQAKNEISAILEEWGFVSDLDFY